MLLHCLTASLAGKIAKIESTWRNYSPGASFAETLPTEVVGKCTPVYTIKAEGLFSVEKTVT